MSDKKYLYLFSEGNKDMREILGGKGANLAEMTNAGMPVPQGFTISTEACTQYYNDGRQINEGIMADIYEYIGKMEEIVGKKFGDPANPLLVSVRSGARASMPLSLIHISSWLSMDACSSSVKVRPASAKAFSTQT